MKMENKKYDGFAVASFVLGLVQVIEIIMVKISQPSNLQSIILITYALILSSIVLGIVGLIRVKGNENKKGMLFAVLGILMALIFIILIFRGFFSTVIDIM